MIKCINYKQSQPDPDLEAIKECLLQDVPRQSSPFRWTLKDPMYSVLAQPFICRKVPVPDHEQQSYLLFPVFKVSTA